MTDNELEPVDGTVFAYTINHYEGLVYATLAGMDEDKPMIVAFDRTDLDELKRARKELRAGVDTKREPDPGAILQILNEANHGASLTHDRVEYRYSALEGKWVAWGRTDTDS